MLCRCPLLLYLFPMATSASFHGWLLSTPRLYETKSNWTVCGQDMAVIYRLFPNTVTMFRYLCSATTMFQRTYEIGLRIVIYKARRTVETIPQTPPSSLPQL